MLKTRVMPTLLLKDSVLVKGRQFLSDRPVGYPLQAIKIYNLREVDELVFLDVSATLRGRPPEFSQIDELADECFMPMTVGGGISSVGHIAALLAAGADKISINSGAIANPQLISHGAQSFGSQCIVASIDIRREAGGWRVYSHSGTRPTDLDAVRWACQTAELGAGEILLTSIDRDGTMTGYDVDLIREVTSAVNIPVIASGGAGEFSHMADALSRGGASAVAAASIFHFTEKTPREAKLYLQSKGFDMRI